MKPILLSLTAAVAAAVVSLTLKEASLIYLVCALVFVSASVFTGACLLARQFQWQRIRTVLLPAAVFLIIASTHLPLRLAFFLYRGQFDRLASEIQAGAPVETPVWVGPFRIEMAGRRGVPYLASNRDRWEIDGFVRDPEGHGFNLWSRIPLDGNWAYISED